MAHNPITQGIIAHTVKIFNDAAGQDLLSISEAPVLPAESHPETLVVTVGFESSTKPVCFYVTRNGAPCERSYKEAMERLFGFRDGFMAATS